MRSWYLIYIQFLTGLFVLICVSFADTTSFLILNDSIITNYPRAASYNSRALQKKLKAQGSTAKSIRVTQFFDSLGYFNPQWDTLTSDSIYFRPGNRSRVVEEVVTGVDSVLFKSLPNIQTPYFYDAGFIRQRADQLNNLVVNNGYPFSTVTINLKRKSQEDFSVQYIVFTDQYCHMAEPLFHGPFITNRNILLNDIFFKRGDPFNLQNVYKSEKKLKNRSYIKKIEISSPEIDTTAVSGPTVVHVPVYIEDHSGIGLDGAAGFAAARGEKAALYGNFSLSLVNVFHAAEAASFDYAGNKTDQKLKIDISKPWIFNLPLMFDASMALEVVKDQYGFISGQTNFFIEVGTNWRIGIGVNGMEVTPKSDTVAEHGTFIGAEFTLARMPERFQKNAFSQEFIIKTGGGLSRKSNNYSRTHLDFLAGLHLPFLDKQALRFRFISKHLITEEQKLIPAELYRVGGANSVRGYQDNEFAFRTVIYGQIEQLLYFTRTGAIYIFSDGGIGFENKIDLNEDYRLMFGYGVGIRLPSKVGNMTLEWARNITDKRSFGRVHIRFQNELAYNSQKTISRF